MMEYQFSKASINSDRLLVEITNSLSQPLYINTVGSDITIAFSDELTQEQQDAVASIIAAHQPVIASEVISKKITGAIEFGKALMLSYATENVLSQYTLEQIKDIINRTAKVQTALSTGSLYVALDELALVETDETVITTEKISTFRHKIQDYLEIPRT